GLVLQRRPAFSDRLLPLLNAWILKVAIPALTLLYLSRLALGPRLLLPVAAAWLVFGLAWAWVRLLRPWLGLDRAGIGCLILMAGLGNTSFVGFPLIRLLYGESGLQTAVLVDQPGTFLILGTLGLIVASAHAGSSVSPRTLAIRVLSFPPFIAFLAAMLAQILGWQPTGPLAGLLQLLGASLGPLALLAVGLQLKPILDRELLRPLLAGLSFKLLLAPLLIAAIYAGGLQLRGELVQVCILEAGMGPMITAAIVAGSYGLQPRLAGMMLAVGVPLSLLTVPLLNWVFQGLAGT
ncbi:MAG: AEC family transporter, partial [Candidatus Sericytochromatia bacterium]